ncbi:MAG: phosphoribosylformylglycinamidine synthase [Bacteriovoracaceae bacterium]|jgi:phosphoribosylformylglycinamidine synthase
MLGPKVLVLTGEGINCERETAFAFEKAGAVPTIKTLNEVIKRPSSLNDYDILAIPGGFSYGDEIGSGHVFSLKLKKHLGNEIKEFIKNKKPIIGICNGFQVLVKLGLFDSSNERQIGLAPNTSGAFINKWARLIPHKENNCIWVKGLNKEFSLPIRHGEGRIVLKQEEVYSDLVKKGQVVLSYENDINGSFKNIAGLCDDSGLVFGLMPHPEADLFKATSPEGSESPLEFSMGYEIFKNSVEYIKSKEGKNL